MRRLFLAAGFIAAFSAAKSATNLELGDHLEPLASPFGDPALIDQVGNEYQRRVLAALKPAFDRNVLARVIEIPSQLPKPESAVGIEEIQGRLKIFALWPEKPIQAYTLAERLRRELASGVGDDYEKDLRRKAIASFESEFPPDYRDVTINRCEVEIGRSLGEKVVKVWRAMLLQTRYTDWPLNGPIPGSFDGSTFYFSMTSRGAGTMMGYSTGLGAKVGAFVRVATTMSNLCATSEGRFSTQLERDVDGLLARLQSP